MGIGVESIFNADDHLSAEDNQEEMDEVTLIEYPEGVVLQRLFSPIVQHVADIIESVHRPGNHQLHHE